MQVSIGFSSAPCLPVNDETLPVPTGTWFFEDSNAAIDKSIQLEDYLKSLGYRRDKAQCNWFDKREDGKVTRTYIEGFYYFAYNPEWEAGSCATIVSTQVFN